ncbi:Imidazole glycerol phosphate synthase subunit HisH 1 [Planctomycetes bacterium Pan216]|uniref:Imidazole glycerol phosphate synthase subunit HisH n=1 Tax=Kolteria novifilia TaxID=2527975 RepID=A0A518B3J0_9BACT|nr:Imidazole glycerol phosphate synthase subunit HisH 1 [Planctomycetes bacterium Pan216]
MERIGLIDYGAGNTTSVLNALEHLRLDVTLARTPEDLENADRLILPGVGAFASAMRKLERLALVDALGDHVVERKKPFLGICVGMQLLADLGHEFETYPGLGYVAGEVKRLRAEEVGLRVPHIGWNEVDYDPSCPLFEGMSAPAFYFVHSYVIEPSDPTSTVATCLHGGPFAAAVRRGNIFGVQFHPEKSQRDGLKLLENFASFEVTRGDEPTRQGRPSVADGSLVIRSR